MKKKLPPPLISDEGNQAHKGSKFKVPLESFFQYSSQKYS